MSVANIGSWPRGTRQKKLQNLDSMRLGSGTQAPRPLERYI
jgi:hypothetical protein